MQIHYIRTDFIGTFQSGKPVLKNLKVFKLCNIITLFLWVECCFSIHLEKQNKSIYLRTVQLTNQTTLSNEEYYILVTERDLAIWKSFKIVFNFLDILYVYVLACLRGGSLEIVNKRLFKSPNHTRVDFVKATSFGPIQLKKQYGVRRKGLRGFVRDLSCTIAFKVPVFVVDQKNVTNMLC